MQQGKATAHSGLYARRKRVLQPLWHTLVVEVSPQSSLRVSPRWARVQGSILACRVQHRHVWRQLQLAGTDLDAGQCADHTRAAEHVSVLWSGLQSGMSDRLGKLHDAV